MVFNSKYNIMSNSYEKYLELKEEGAFDFDPTNYEMVLQKAAKIGLKTQILYSAMDLIRDNSELTNSAAILLASKNWNVI